MGACSEKPGSLLKVAKAKIDESQYIAFTTTAYYPIPESDLVDTITTWTEVVRNNKDSLGYSFIQKDDRSDRVYTADKLQVANHQDNVIRTYLPKHFEKPEELVETAKNNFRNNWSPLSLFNDTWTYVKDSTIGNVNLKNYSRIENDRVYNGKKIHTEQHNFINKTAVLTQFERRNYIDGILSQRVVIHFSNYEFNKNSVELSYNLPKNYVSAYGKEKSLPDLEQGEIAPGFSGVTMGGDSISLKMYAGKKVLLNFSVVSCGYCKQALDHFNQDDFELADDVSIIYINPEDNKSKLTTYMKRTPIPFPVIAEAQSIAQKYGGSSFPRYFLIDEKGIIEKMQVGFSAEFIDKFRK